MSNELGRREGVKDIREPLLAASETADRNTPEIYEFGPFRLEPVEHKLLRDGVTVALTPKVFEMLVILVRNSGHLLDKDDLIRSLWPDSFVEEGNLSNNIFMLRKALGNDREYIETVPRRGYRFVGAVRQLPPSTPSAVLDVSEVKSREVRGGQGPGARKVFVGGIVAALLVLAAIVLFQRLKGAGSSSGSDQPHLAMEQRLTSNPYDVPVTSAVISPDGNYLAYTDTNGFYLRQISTEETHPWPMPKGFDPWPRSWYPDNAHLLVVNPGPGPDPSSLYKFSIMGGEPQKLVSDARGGWVSPDGSRIAYLSSANWGDLWVVDADGVNPRKVVAGLESDKSGSSQKWIYRVAWSPSGRHLAYIEVRDRATTAPIEPIRSLRMVDPDGKRASLVLEDARLGEALWWGAEDRILFSYREDPASAQRNYGVYSIRLDLHTGRAISSPQPVSNAEGSINGMSGTADGRRLVLWRFRIAAQVFLSDYDAATRQWKEPRRLIPDTNENLAWAWTPDSKGVFFISNRNGTWKLFKQGIDETTPEILVEGRSISLPRLSADGTQVLYLSSSNPDDLSFPADVMSKPIGGGPPRVVVHGRRITNLQCATAPATLCLFSEHDGDDLTFRLFDPEHGPGRALLKLPHEIWRLSGNWTLSPDGSMLVLFLDQHRLRFFSIASGAAHDVTVKDWLIHHGDWGANGRRLFIPSHSPDGFPVVLEVDQTGKAKVVLKGKPNSNFGWMIQSPDLRHAVVGEYIPTENNAWMLSDF